MNLRLVPTMLAATLTLSACTTPEHERFVYPEENLSAWFQEAWGDGYAQLRFDGNRSLSQAETDSQDQEAREAFDNQRVRVVGNSTGLANMPFVAVQDEVRRLRPGQSFSICTTWLTHTVGDDGVTEIGEDQPSEPIPFVTLWRDGEGTLRGTQLAAITHQEARFLSEHEGVRITPSGLGTLDCRLPDTPSGFSTLVLEFDAPAERSGFEDLLGPLLYSWEGVSVKAASPVRDATGAIVLASGFLHERIGDQMQRFGPPSSTLEGTRWVVRYPVEVPGGLHVDAATAVTIREDSVVEAVVSLPRVVNQQVEAGKMLTPAAAILAFDRSYASEKPARSPYRITGLTALLVDDADAEVDGSRDQQAVSSSWRVSLDVQGRSGVLYVHGRTGRVFRND